MKLLDHVCTRVPVCAPLAWGAPGLCVYTGACVCAPWLGELLDHVCTRVPVCVPYDLGSSWITCAHGCLCVCSQTDSFVRQTAVRLCVLAQKAGSGDLTCVSWRADFTLPCCVEGKPLGRARALVPQCRHFLIAFLRLSILFLQASSPMPDWTPIVPQQPASTGPPLELFLDCFLGLYMPLLGTPHSCDQILLLPCDKAELPSPVRVVSSSHI